MDTIQLAIVVGLGEALWFELSVAGKTYIKMSANDFTKKIEKASNAAECLQVKNELTALLAKVSTKLEGFQEQDKKTGLAFQGQNAIKCVCGNTMEPDGAYIGACDDCGEVYCIDCLCECDGCPNRICDPTHNEEEPCAIMCTGCENSMFCSDCGKRCDCREEKFCRDGYGDGCLKESGPYGHAYCPECFEYINDH